MSSDAVVIRQWSRSYAVQARADWEAYEALCVADPPLPRCEELHFLQMACEKLCKAHELKDGKEGIKRKTHQCIRKVLPSVIRQSLWPSGKIPKQQKGEFGQLVQLAGTLAPLIESLAPLKDGVPNSEYPWQEKDGRIRIPAEHDFHALAALLAPDGIKLVKALKNATQQIITFHES